MGAKKVTLESFIERSKVIHGDKYGYSLVQFKKVKDKVDIFCKFHNAVFSQSVFCHLQGSGCQVCGIVERTKIQITNVEEFVIESKSTHGDKYDYSLVKFNGVHNNVDIKCKVHNSVFSQKIYLHIKGSGCPLCGSAKSALAKFSSKEKFIAKAKLVHGDKYDYSLVEYGGTSVPVDIICDKGHIFSQTPSGHLSDRGCKICSGTYLSNTEEFIEKAIKIHGTKYNYEKVVYIKANKKVIIGCDKHSDYSITPNKHLMAQGCRKCVNENINSGWGVTLWEEKEHNSKHFVAYEVYVIRCFNEFENFYKIGRTSVGIKQRFNSYKYMPYTYEIMKIFSGTAREMYDLENILQKNNKSHKYLPMIEFKGQQECFKFLINIDKIDYGVK